MFHALALVEVEDGGAEHFFKAFLQIAFVYGHLTTEFFYREGFTDMLQQDLACLDDLFAIGFIGQEFTLETFDFFFTDHAFQAIEQEHLALCVYEDILVAVGEAVVEKGLEHEAGATTEGKRLGKGLGMSEFQEIIAGGTFLLARACELGEVYGQEAETKGIDGIDAFRTAGAGVELTGITFDVFLFAIDVAGDTKSQFQVVLCSVFLAVVVDHLAHIVEAPLGIPAIAFDGITYGTGYLAFFFAQGNQLVSHDWLAVGRGQEIRSLVHHFANLYLRTRINAHR